MGVINYFHMLRKSFIRYKCLSTLLWCWKSYAADHHTSFQLLHINTIHCQPCWNDIKPLTAFPEISEYTPIAEYWVRSWFSRFKPPLFFKLSAFHWPSSSIFLMFFCNSVSPLWMVLHMHTYYLHLKYIHVHRIMHAMVACLGWCFG